MHLNQIVALGFFLALNFCLLSISLYFALKTNLRGALLWTACLEIYLFIITVLLGGLGEVGMIMRIPVAILVIVPGLMVWTGTEFRGKLKSIFSQAGAWSFLSAILMLCFFVFMLDGLFHPFFSHDPLTYELFFPARWLQDHRLELIPTPFGDNSRAYDAANAMIYYLWLMLPFHNDLLAHTGGFFFAVFCVFSLTALSEALGLQKYSKYLGGLFFLLVPLVVRETESAHSDLLLCGQFLAFIAFAIAKKSGQGRGLDLLAVMALGGMIGTKYISLPILLLLLPVFAVCLLRPFPKLKNIFAWVVLFFLAGGFWYVRNWYLTGNPVFPLQVQFGSLIILKGAYTRAVMDHWIFKIWTGRSVLSIISEGPRPLFQTALVFFFMVCSLFAFLGGVLKSGKKEFVAIYLAVLPLLIHFSAAYFLPFHMARFWLPAWAAAAAVIAIMVSTSPMTGRWLAIAFFMLSAVEVGIEILSTSSGIMSVFAPTTKSPGLFLKLLPFAFLLALVARNLKLWKKVVFGLFAFIILIAWSQPGYFSRRARVMELGAEAVFLDQLPAGQRIAYTGRNIPYPLMGSRLQNQVFYVNVNAHRAWKFHDYAERFRQTFPGKMPHSPEPAFYRMENNFSDWFGNLAAAKAGVLAICPVGDNELVNICHDRQRLPIEFSWAQEHPENFKLLFQSQCLIYKVDYPAAPGPRPSDQAQCPMDVFDLSDRETIDKFFPRAFP
jgi:hypothetical protein